MRRARYLGLQKTHLEHVFSAVALNLIRLDGMTVSAARDEQAADTVVRTTSCGP